MEEKLKQFALSIGIDQIGIAPVRLYSELADKLPPAPFTQRQRIEDRINPLNTMPNAQSAIVYLIPYYDGKQTKSNLSRYAWGRDYHEVAQEISAKFHTFLQENYQNYEGKDYCDISPIPQKHLAYLAGLGFFGDNHLLINEKYGTWFFIAHVLTNIPFVADRPLEKECQHCGKCHAACPSKVFDRNPADFFSCVSAITQKKSPLTKEEEKLFAHSVWGCDLCQNVCPHNERVALSPLLSYFGEPISFLDEQNIMPTNRAYSYKRKPFMLRNISLYQQEN